MGLAFETMNTKQLCICLLVLLGFSSCQPGLYMPATPNTPFVDSTHRTDIKAGFSYKHVELQANRLVDSHKIVQVQLSQRVANQFRGGRYEIGIGKMHSVNSSTMRYSIWGLGYSFSRDLSDGNLGFRDWRSTQQIPFYGQFGVIKSFESKKISFNFRPAIVYVPYAQVGPFFHFNGSSFSRFYHVFYSVVDISASLRTGVFTITAGSKFPSVTSHSLLKEFETIEEYFYLRLTFNLTKPN